MPFRRHYLPSLNFALSRAFGVIRDRDVVEHVRALNEEAGRQEGVLELGDARGLKPADLRELTIGGALGAAGLEEGQTRARGGKLAILADHALIYGFARAYTTISSQFRQDSSAFRELEPALEWLGLTAHKEEIVAFMDEARARDEEELAAPTKTDEETR